MSDNVRLEKILGLLLVELMKDADFPAKVRALVFAGFSHAEVAEMIGSTADSVKQTAYNLRKGLAKGAIAKNKKKKAA